MIEIQQLFVNFAQLFAIFFYRFLQIQFFALNFDLSLTMKIQSLSQVSSFQACLFAFDVLIFDPTEFLAAQVYLRHRRWRQKAQTSIASMRDDQLFTARAPTASRESAGREVERDFRERRSPNL